MAKVDVDIACISRLKKSPKSPKSTYHCCVPKCNSDSRYNLDITFHHFPAAESLKLQWINSICDDAHPLCRVSVFVQECYAGLTPH